MIFYNKSRLIIDFNLRFLKFYRRNGLAAKFHSLFNFVLRYFLLGFRLVMDIRGREMKVIDE